MGVDTYGVGSSGPGLALRMPSVECIPGRRPAASTFLHKGSRSELTATVEVDGLETVNLFERIHFT